ncbi:hypothetical protein QNH91_29060, partial [Klebsiella pneumoniae]|uniref:hypothetical protein n=1 Tax=Klebsiella pneumoniae TaxID=573 RepID=UPI002555614B
SEMGIRDRYILRRCQADNSDIKDMIRRALTIKVTDPEFIRRQEKNKNQGHRTVSYTNLTLPTNNTL